jgi:lipid-binding SYLF domain-containing protein
MQFLSGSIAVLSLAAAAIVASPARAQVSPEQIVVNATNVLAQSAGVPSGIPQNLLSDAQGIVIIPNMIRGAFVIGLQHGRGVLLVRGPNGAWQAPQFVTMTGGSLGYQIGVQSTDLILVFRTPRSVQNLLRGSLRVGVDASAAAGPVGRQASAATDTRLQAEILSYSRARGAFVGVSLDGSSVSLDPSAQAVFYQPPGVMPLAATRLIQTLTSLSSGANPAVVPPVQQTVAPGPSTPLPGSQPTSPPSNAVPPTAPPAPPRAAPIPAAPQSPSELEAARQQLDAVSRQLAASLDEQWLQFLALPPEVYMPGHAPSLQALEQAISHYETVANDPQFAALTSRPDFQDTLRGLWRLGELQQGTQQLRLPPPPVVSANR